MRGGSIPMLGWGALLAVMLVGCWVWTGRGLEVAEFGFAVSVIWGGAVLFAAMSDRESIRKGEPRPQRRPESIPTASLGAVGIGIGIGSVMFGFAFGRFLVYFGAGLIIAALGRVAYEILDERRARRAWTEREPR